MFPKITPGRWAIVIVCVVLLVLMRQFMRETLYWLNYRIYYILVEPWVSKVVAVLNKLVPINLFNYWFYSKPLFMLVHFGLILLLLAAIYNSKRHVKTAAVIMFGWMVFFVLLNFLLRKVAPVESYLQSTRVAIDLMLEPFAVAFLIPTLLLVPPVEKPENKIFKKF